MIAADPSSIATSEDPDIKAVSTLYSFTWPPKLEKGKGTGEQSVDARNEQPSTALPETLLSVWPYVEGANDQENHRPQLDALAQSFLASIFDSLTPLTDKSHEGMTTEDTRTAVTKALVSSFKDTIWHSKFQPPLPSPEEFELSDTESSAESVVSVAHTSEKGEPSPPV